MRKFLNFILITCLVYVKITCVTIPTHLSNKTNEHILKTENQDNSSDGSHEDSSEKFGTVLEKEDASYNYFYEDQDEDFQETNTPLIFEEKLHGGNLLGKIADELKNKKNDQKKEKNDFKTFEEKMQPPHFMTDLYNALTEFGEMPHGASTVRSIPESHPESPGLFKFEINREADAGDLLEAELHVYRLGLEPHRSTYEQQHYPQPYYLLRVYQMMPTPTNKISLNPDVHQLLNVHYVSAFATGWQVFKVKRAVETWKDGKLPNLGLLVTATTVFGEPVEVRFARKGRNLDGYQPNLVLFTKSSKISNSTEFQPHAALNNHTIFKRSIISSEKVKVSTAECSRQELIVELREIYPLIVAPHTIDISICFGHCLSTSLISKYSDLKVRNILLNAKELGCHFKECCVPTAYEELTILYFNEHLDTVLDKIPDMLVKSCGCLV